MLRRREGSECGGHVVWLGQEGRTESGEGRLSVVGRWRGEYLRLVGFSELVRGLR